jgi:hypothetical protein
MEKLSSNENNKGIRGSARFDYVRCLFQKPIQNSRRKIYPQSTDKHTSFLMLRTPCFVFRSRNGITCLVLAFSHSWALTLVILSAIALLTFVQAISQSLFPLRALRNSNHNNTRRPCFGFPRNGQRIQRSSMLSRRGAESLRSRFEFEA